MNHTMKRLSVLMTTASVDMIGLMIVVPLLPYYARHLNVEDWMIGPMIAVFSVAQLVSAPLWGRFSDRYGRRVAILIGLSTSAVAFTVFAFATSYWWLFASRLVQGIGGGITGVLQAYVADVSAPKDRAKALGWLSAATNAGVTIGPVIGMLAFSLGRAAPGLVAAGLVLVNITFAARWLPESKPQSHGNGERRSIRGMVLEIVFRPRDDVARLVWIYAVGMLGFMSMTAVMALYLQDAFGVNESTIGVFFVYVGALGLVMRAVILGRMIDWLGETKVMRIGAGLLAVGLAAIPLPSSVWVLGAVMGLVPIGTALLFPTETALLTHRVNEGERGQILGVQQAFGGVARVVAPIWALAAFQGLGAAVPFQASGLVVGLVLFLAFRVREAPLAEVASPG